MAFPTTSVLDTLDSAGGLSANWTTPALNNAGTVTESAPGPGVGR